MLFDISQNPAEHKGGMTFDLTHNSRKQASIAAELTNVSDHAYLPCLHQRVCGKHIIEKRR